MNTSQIQVQYITSHEGLRDAMIDVLKELKLLANHNIEEPKALPPPANRHQASAFLSVSLPTLDSLLKTGQIPSFRIGNRVRINWVDLEDYVKQKGDC